MSRGNEKLFEKICPPELNRRAFCIIQQIRPTFCRSNGRGLHLAEKQTGEARDFRRTIERDHRNETVAFQNQNARRNAYEIASRASIRPRSHSRLGLCGSSCAHAGTTFLMERATVCAARGFITPAGLADRTECALPVRGYQESYSQSRSCRRP